MRKHTSLDEWGIAPTSIAAVRDPPRRATDAQNPARANEGAPLQSGTRANPNAG